MACAAFPPNSIVLTAAAACGLHCEKRIMNVGIKNMPTKQGDIINVYIYSRRWLD